MTALLLLNGPNLNLLGQREPEVYGHASLAEIEADSVAYAAQQGANLDCVQSNHEGVLIDALHSASKTCAGAILNAGAYTHSSMALRDAISATRLPVIELHLSNIHAREEFRHHSMIAPVCIGVICGFGAAGYQLAIDAMLTHLKQRQG